MMALTLLNMFSTGLRSSGSKMVEKVVMLLSVEHAGQLSKHGGCRVQNNIFKMGGHHGQPIPKLVGHLHKLLEHGI